MVYAIPSAFKMFNLFKKKITKCQYSPDHYIFGLIGVWCKIEKDEVLYYYVKRSSKMDNYPNTWGLLSRQWNRNDYHNILGLKDKLQPLFQEMSVQRLDNTPIKVIQWLATQANKPEENPLGCWLYLDIFQIELEKEPVLNPEFYTEAKWMTRKDILNLSITQECGRCTEMLTEFLRWHRLKELDPAKGWIYSGFIPKESSNVPIGILSKNPSEVSKA